MILLRMLVFLILSGGVLAGACAANNEDDENCNDWLAKSVKLMESKPMKERVKIFLVQVSHACDKIPQKLVRAARSSADADPDQRYRILKKASASFFQKSCLDNPSPEPAKYLPPSCREVHTAILSNISSGEYLYGRAMEKELEKISNIDSFYSRRIMLNYFLSAAILYEERHGL